MDQISVENPYVSEETPIDQLTWKFKIGCLDVNTTGSQRYVLFSVLTISTLFFCLISAYLQVNLSERARERESLNKILDYTSKGKSQPVN